MSPLYPRSGSDLFVSILVFVELALDGSAVAAPAILCISVSILVFVELALDGAQNRVEQCH